jgi:hypothetical protein
MNPSNVYIVAVETVAILSLTLIALMGMYKGQNEIAAAAVGGIAGFISHKSLSKASESGSDSKKPSPEQSEPAITAEEKAEEKEKRSEPVEEDVA